MAVTNRDITDWYVHEGTLTEFLGVLLSGVITVPGSPVDFLESDTGFARTASKQLHVA